MSNKYYAVKVGKKPGIYKTWDECKEQVNKFPGAIYKSFKTLEEAEKFSGEKRVLMKIKIIS
ncbi:caulimovirus viroplasmin family protein [[Clostridium] sordellii ATCC 9714]|nr:caulimovirus viroplasmin family protein [[Clostridium] sordellii ATCC 9714] [Paeniclostridium sordellii ATCC 9714]